MTVRIFERDGRWFYTFKNEYARTSTRLCRECKTRKEAELYVSRLKFVSSSPYLISNITKDMYLPGSRHLHRLYQLGRNLCDRTIEQYRSIVEIIQKEFGNEVITKLKPRQIQQRLLDDDKHSASWKNFYLGTFRQIYDETMYCCPQPVPAPQFQHFLRHSRKADIFTTKELLALFTSSAWCCYDCYLLFLVIYSCGLRLGEARALRVSQILTEERMLIVNGFCKRNGDRTCYNKKGSETDSKIRAVPVPKDTFEKLEKYIAEKNLEQDDFIFTRKNMPMNDFFLREHFYKALKNAGISRDGKRKLIPHSLRFTYVTRMRRSLSVELVQKLVGHTSPEMTEYYTRFAIQELVVALKDSFSAVEKLFE